MLNIIKKAGIINRANDEILYEYVLDEMDQGIQIKGLWAKALAHSDGMESKAESMYMQYRVQSIKDQFDALKIAYDEMSRKRLFDYIKNGFKEPVQEIKKIEEVKQVEETKKVEKPIVSNENYEITWQDYNNSFDRAKQEWKKEGTNLVHNESTRSLGEFLKIILILLAPLILIIVLSLLGGGIF